MFALGASTPRRRRRGVAGLGRIAQVQQLFDPVQPVVEDGVEIAPIGMLNAHSWRALMPERFTRTSATTSTTAMPTLTASSTIVR